MSDWRLTDRGRRLAGGAGIFVALAGLLVLPPRGLYWLLVTVLMASFIVSVAVAIEHERKRRTDK